MKNVFVLVVFSAVVLGGLVAQSEPWVSNRFAQNCAACHAPGRVNLPPPDRRCTLSCQGCHVNPSGGGLRNLYGRWNQERWLWSWRPEGWKLGKQKPAELAEQPYERAKLAKYLKDVGDNNKAERILVQSGHKMRVGGDQVNEAEKFNKYNTASEKVIEPDYGKFLMTIPQGDPLRESREMTVLGGGDVRYLYFHQKDDTRDKAYSVPMSAEIGVQLKPVQHVSTVIEGRFLNGPTATSDNSEWDNLFTSGAMAKSAYVLVDDLPFNTFLLYGMNRPLFGNYNPDHTNLLNTLTYGANRSMRAVYKTASIGTAPNVPFLNVHFLSPISNPNYSQDKGYIINAGARFVTYGASFLLSYWDTESTSSSEKRRKMLSFSAGGMFGKYIGVLDINRYQRDTPAGTSDAGIVYALENKYQLWRENYLVLNYYTSNTASDLTEGSSNELQYGIKSFPLGGLEVEVLGIEAKDKKVSSGESKESRFQGQVHLFF